MDVAIRGVAFALPEETMEQYLERTGRRVVPSSGTGYIIGAVRRPPDERTVEEQDEGTLESRGVPSDESYVGRILYCERVSPDEFPKPENL